jgi:hypothetical protein
MKRVALGLVLVVWVAALIYVSAPTIALAACHDCDDDKAGHGKCIKVPAGAIECTPSGAGCILKGKCEGKPKAAAQLRLEPQTPQVRSTSSPERPTVPKSQ